MTTHKSNLIALLLCSTTAIAAPASESSIKQLLSVTQVQKIVDGIQTQFDTLINNAIQHELQGKTPTLKQQQAIKNMKTRLVETIHGEISWKKLEPMYIRLYKESFSDEDVAGMLEFYKTPAGQAVIYKMPILMQKTMLEVQKMTSGMQPKIQKIQKQFTTEMASASK